MDVFASIWLWLLSGHTGLSTSDYALNVLFALLGASVTVFATNPHISLPKFKESTFEPGALGLYIIGVSTAVAIGHRIPVPFLVGMLAPVVVPFLLKSTVPSLLKTLQPMVVAALEAALGRSKGGKV